MHVGCGATCDAASAVARAAAGARGGGICTRGAGARDRRRSPATRLRARRPGRAAARRRGAAVERGRRLRRDLHARHGEARPLRRLLADGVHGLPRRVRRGRPREPVRDARDADAGRERPRDPRRDAAGLALGLDLPRARAARRVRAAGGARDAGGRDPGRQPAPARCGRGARRLARSRPDPGAAGRGLRHQGRPRADARVDAARARGRAGAGLGRAERRRGQGRHHRPDPLPAAVGGAAGLGVRAHGGGLRDGVLRSRDRTHAAPPEGGAGVLEREPDGRRRRGARHGARRRRCDRGHGRGLLRLAPRAGEGRAVPVGWRDRRERPRAARGGAGAGAAAVPRARRPAVHRRRDRQVRGQGPARRRRGRLARGGLGGRHDAADAAFLHAGSRAYGSEDPQATASRRACAGRGSRWRPRRWCCRGCCIP